MQIFYTPDLQPQAPIYILNEEESKHCIRVLRLQAGQVVQLVDGRGGIYQAHIIDAHPKKTQLQIVTSEQNYGQRNHYLHVAVAPTKNLDRLEWFLEKATEIGIDEITLLLCQRSERKEAKTDRLDKIITSAVKQSLKAYHPRLNPVTAYQSLVSQSFDGQKFIAHCVNDTGKFTLSSQVVLNGRYLIMIGPEGDFTEKEIADALHHQFQPITLGESRLRTETAALAACFEINWLNRKL